MTDEEMLEFANLVVSIHPNTRYNKLSTMFHKNFNSIRSEYNAIIVLVKSKVPNEEILSMTHEQRLTYLYLFGEKK